MMGVPKYDVFLSHNSADKPAVEEIALRLKQEGVEPWLDKWHLIPGDSWMGPIERALEDSGACAVFVGPAGWGNWHGEEMRAAIDRRVAAGEGNFRVIPVLLPGADQPKRGELPTFLAAATWVEFRRGLDDPEAFRRLVCGIRGTEPGYEPGAAPFEGQCPYRGLRAFDEAHAGFFFGREKMTERLLDKLRPAPPMRAENRFLGVIGPSGSGKSSLTLAGLVPALKRGDLGDGGPWPVAICRPGHDPLESLAIQTTKAVGREPGLAALRGLIDGMASDPRSLHLFARQAMADAPPSRRLAVVVDQFEEVFTLCRDDAARRALVDNLIYASGTAGGQVVVVLTLRADFYGKCTFDPALAAALSDHQVLVGPMSDDELRRAIERPAQLVGCEPEPGLTEVLLQDAGREPGALPLLQYALRELWERRKGRRLTHAAYAAIGGLGGALENRANAILGEFTAPERELCRRIFLRLTQPGEGTEDTKRRAQLSELSGGGSEPGEDVARVVGRLIDARLITAEGDGRPDDGGAIEVAHEALIRGWGELRRWIDADRAGLRTHRRLTEAAREWVAEGHHRRDLYFGARLAVAREWAASHPGEPSALEAEFLEASRTNEEWRKAEEERREADKLEAARRLAEEARNKLRAWRLASAAVVAAVAFGGVAALAWNGQRTRRTHLRTEVQDARDAARGLAEGAGVRHDLAAWESAIQSAERAMGLARSGVEDEALLAEVKAELDAIRRLRDRDRLDDDVRHRLEEARILGTGVKVGERGSTFDFGPVAEAYRRAFRDYGIDLDLEQVAGRGTALRASPIRETLAAALDEWAAQETDRALAARLLALAREADPDELRNAIRDAVAKRDRAELERRAHDPRAADLPAATLLRLAGALQDAGEPGEGLALLRRAQQLHPNDFWINHELGHAYWNGIPPRLDEAIGCFTAARALRPESPNIRVDLADALEAKGDHDGAIAQAQEALRLRPDYPEARITLGDALLNKGDIDGAMGQARKALEVRPGSANAHNNLGNARLAKGEVDAAIAEYREAIRLRPRYAVPHYNLGRAHSKKGDDAEAEAEYGRAIALSPEHSGAHANLGHLLAKRGKADEAIAEYVKAIRAWPDNAWAHFDLGLVLSKKGDYLKASQEYREVLRIDPDDADAHNNLAGNLLNLRDNRAAVAEYAEVVRLRPAQPVPRFRLGNALLKLDDLPGGIAALDEAIRLKPDYAEAHARRGDALARKGDLAGAIDAYRKAVAIKPDDPEALDTLGDLLAKGGDAARVVDVRRDAVKLRPDDPEARERLGDALARAGDADAAIAAYREALRVNPADYSTVPKLADLLTRAGDPDAAILVYRRAVARRLFLGGESYLKYGRLLTSEGDADAAIVEFQMAAQSAPSAAEARNQLGLILLRRGDVSGAFAEFREAVLIAPGYADARNNFGNTFAKSGNAAAAIAEYRAAIRIQPDHAHAHLNLGYQLAIKGRVDEALKEFHEAVRLRPDDTQARAYLGITEGRKGDIRGAIAQFREAARLSYRSQDFYTNLGFARRSAWDGDAAIAMFRQAARLAPDSPDAHADLALALIDAGRLDEAIAEGRRAVGLRPRAMRYHRSLGDALSVATRFDEAADEYRRAVEIRPDDPASHASLGRALRWQGKYPEALAELVCAQELGARGPRWDDASSLDRIDECRRLIALDLRMPAILKGEAEPAGAIEWRDAARIAQHRRLVATSARFFVRAFAERPALADDLDAGDRYDAACVAALAGAGLGADAPTLDESARARWRARALAWLGDDLSALAKRLDGDPKAAAPVLRRLRHWRLDPDLAGLRDEPAPAGLPAPERAACRALWAGVDRLIREAEAAK